MMLAAMALAFVVTAACADEPAVLIPGQWTREQAGEWHKKQPWLVGCNFLPSTAVNDVEMWQAETFDPKTIDRELGMAEELGLNSVRVFLNYVVWKADPDGFKKRFSQFLEIADKHGISVMPIFSTIVLSRVKSRSLESRMTRFQACTTAVGCQVRASRACLTAPAGRTWRSM
jgi:hypothetical protein